MLFQISLLALAVVGAVRAEIIVERGYTQASGSPTGIPDYLVTSPELFPGPTPTGSAAFLAQTNKAPFTGVSYIPNTPLETQVPISGNTGNKNIFQLMGQLSHYFPNPDGFGVNEYPLPQNAFIKHLQMLSRHGARYPTSNSGAQLVGQKITNYTSAGGKFPSGPLSFLNNWSYKLGAEILVPVGKQELFDSGTLHQIMYGHLYPNNGSKIYARTTTQDRMLQSAEYFMAGFFGLKWTDNVTLVVAIEGSGTWNDTLAGYDNCPNSNTGVSAGGSNASAVWYNIYLKDAVTRLNSYSGSSFNWTAGDAYNAQSLCAYEEVALGYSEFCALFTYEEWEGYEYSVDLYFQGNVMFASPTGRAVGIGYVEEVYARLQHHVITQPTAQINVTLDSNSTIFPTNQSLYFDFSHDTNIASILTAFGLTQFAGYLPETEIARGRQMIVSHMEPFGARLDMEIIETPQPLSGDRSTTTYLQGNTTRYIHFILNQRTIPLGKSYPSCGQRDDGWCELTTFMNVLATKLQEAQYTYSCFGNYPANPYGSITNGVPLPNGASGSNTQTYTAPASTMSATSTGSTCAAATHTVTVTMCSTGSFTLATGAGKTTSRATGTGATTSHATGTGATTLHSTGTTTGTSMTSKATGTTSSTSTTTHGATTGGPATHTTVTSKTTVTTPVTVHGTSKGSTVSKMSKMSTMSKAISSAKSSMKSSVKSSSTSHVSTATKSSSKSSTTSTASRTSTSSKATTSSTMSTSSKSPTTSHSSTTSCDESSTSSSGWGWGSWPTESGAPGWGSGQGWGEGQQGQQGWGQGQQGQQGWGSSQQGW